MKTSDLARSASRAAVRVFDRNGSSENYLTECWRYRNVVRFFARRDLVVRYRRTVIGLGWVLLKPLLAMLIFTVIFGRIAHMPANGIPYPLLVLTGMIPWQFFAAVINESAISLSNNPNLVTKVWLPRILLPFAPLLLNSVDAGINCLLLVAVMCWYHIPPSAHLLLTPLLFLPVVLISLGAGLFAATWMVKYKDIKNIIPIALQFGLLCSPVAFTLHVAPAEWSRWLWLNPLSAPIEWFRWSVVPGQTMPSAYHSILAALEVFVILGSGLWYFRRHERYLADVI